jgi:hypothetical protein
MNRAAVERREHSGMSRTTSSPRACWGKQVGKKVKGLGGDKFAANL